MRLESNVAIRKQELYWKVKCIYRKAGYYTVRKAANISSTVGGQHKGSLMVI